jgi:hypothetical protein
VTSVKVNLRALTSIFRAARTASTTILDNPQNIQTTKVLGDLLHQISSSTYGKIAGHLRDKNPTRVSNAIEQLIKILKRDSALAQQLAEHIEPDDELNNPHVLGAAIIGIHLGHEKIPMLFRSLDQLALSVYPNRSFKEDQFSAFIDDLKQLKETNLLRPVAARHKSSVFALLNLARSQNNELYQTLCQILIRSDVIDLPNRPILPRATRPLFWFQRYHPTKTYLFRPVFLKLGGRYKPFKAFLAAGVVSCLFHALLFSPFLLSVPFSTYLTANLFFIGTHLFRGIRGHLRLAKALHSFKDELANLNPGLPNEIIDKVVARQLFLEKMVYFHDKRLFYREPILIPYRVLKHIQRDPQSVALIYENAADKKTTTVILGKWNGRIVRIRYTGLGKLVPKIDADYASKDEEKIYEKAKMGK